MLLSTNTFGVAKKFGNRKAIELIADAGFDAIDISLHFSMADDNMPFNSENYMDEVQNLRETAEKKGIMFNQAHAVFPTSYSDAEKSKTAYDRVVRGMEIAAALGAKIIIVHPNQHLTYIEGNNAEILKSINYEFYNSLIPYCREFGIKVAVENMWQYSKPCEHIVDSVCSRSAEFKDYIDTLNSGYITACLDLGHCGLVGLKAEDFIRELGHDRLCALHVHDNDFKRDCHVIPMTPFVGKMNWEEICKALADIRYSGDFTFETDYSFSNVNEYNVEAVLHYLHDTGRYLIDKIDDFKKSV